MGRRHNTITIQQEDFDAFTALRLDTAAAKSQHQQTDDSDVFSQDIPDFTTFENKPGPPILPPHLLQIILNKDTPLSCEPPSDFLKVTRVLGFRMVLIP